jgi:hypothetical protein
MQPQGYLHSLQRRHLNFQELLYELESQAQMTTKKNATTPAAKKSGKTTKELVIQKHVQTDLPKAVESPVARKKRMAAQEGLLSALRELILVARQYVAQTVNSTLTMLYWDIGRRIHQDVLKAKRADYGSKTVAALGRKLESEFGRGFGERNLHWMVKFAVVFPNEEIVSALRT